jgi:hypothetical protein
MAFSAVKRPDDGAMWLHLAIVVGLIAAQVVVLLAMGQPAICTCGTVDLWHADPAGPETSQHLTDWYTYTHVIHGFGFYLLLWVVAPDMAVGWRLAIAVGLEAGWELLENTPFIIDRYRESALARGYSGDSVINSVGDTLAAALGFVLARVLPVRWSMAIILAAELIALIMIRDNLALNIIQIIHPSDAISRWQIGQ